VFCVRQVGEQNVVLDIGYLKIFPANGNGFVTDKANA
jgi:hypothetical protein